MSIKLRHFFYISNLLSISRVILLFPLLYLIKINTPDGNKVLMVLAIIAASTDFLDGYFSRKLNQITELGKILDPLADKICMAAILLALVLYRGFPVPLVIFLVYRDILIVIIGYIAMRRIGQTLSANMWGKINTTVISVAGLLYIFNIYNILLTVSLICGYATIIISGYFYMLVGEKLLFEEKPYRYAFRAAIVLTSLLVVYSVHNLRFI